MEFMKKKQNNNKKRCSAMLNTEFHNITKALKCGQDWLDLTADEKCLACAVVAFHSGIDIAKPLELKKFFEKTFDELFSTVCEDYF